MLLAFVTNLDLALKKKLGSIGVVCFAPNLFITVILTKNLKIDACRTHTKGSGDRQRTKLAFATHKDLAPVRNSSAWNYPFRPENPDFDDFLRLKIPIRLHDFVYTS